VSNIFPHLPVRYTSGKGQPLKCSTKDVLSEFALFTPLTILVDYYVPYAS